MVDIDPSQTNPSQLSQPGAQGTSQPPAPSPSSAPASPSPQEEFPRYAPPTPQPTSVPPTLRGGGSKKGLIFVLILLLFAFAGATILLGYQNYQLKQELQQPAITPTPVPTTEPALSPTPTPTSNPTVGWKIYTNQNYNYEVRLPPELAAEEKGKVDDQVLDLTNFILPEGTGTTASISVLSESYESVIARLESEWWGGTEESPNQVGETTVAETNAKKISGTQVSTGHELFEVIFPRGNLTYRISLYIGPEEQELNLNEETFSLILSTFKFLD